MADFSDIGIRVLILGVGEARRSLGMVRGDMNALERDIRKLSGTSITLGKDLTRLGSQLIGVGRTLTLALTTPILALGGTLLRSGIQFEDTFAGVTKTVDGVAYGFRDLLKTEENFQAFLEFYNELNSLGSAGQQFGMVEATELWIASLTKAQREAIFTSEAFGKLTPAGEQLREGIWGLALDLPIAATELNRIAQVAGQLGIPLGESGETLLGFTEIMAGLGIATDLTAEDAAFAFARMANIYQIPTEQMVDWSNRAGSALVRLGNTTASTEPEIMNLAMRMASAGKLANLSIPELFGLSATIAEVGVASERGGTAVSRMFTELMMAPTDPETAQLFSRILGMSAQEFETALNTDTFGVFQDFTTRVNELLKREGGEFITSDELTQLGLGGVRVQDVVRLLGLAQENLGENIAQANSEWEAQIALEEEVRKKKLTLASSLIRLSNAFALVGDTITQLYRDELEGLINKIKSLFVAFSELTPAQQKMIVGIGMLAAALGPAIIVLGIFLQNLGTLITTLGGIPALFMKIIPYILGLSTPVLALAAVIGGLYLAFETNFLGIQTLVQSLIDVFKLSPIMDEISLAIEDIKAGDWQGAFDHIKSAWGYFIQYLEFFAIPQIKRWGRQAIIDLSAAIVAEAQSFPGRISGVGTIIKEAFTDLFSIEVDPETGMEMEDVSGLERYLSQLSVPLEELKTRLDPIIGPITEGLRNLWIGIQGFITNISEAKTDNILSFLLSLSVGLLTLSAAFIGDALSLAGDLLPPIGSGIAAVVNAVNDLKPVSMGLIVGYLAFLGGVKFTLIAAGIVQLAAAQFLLGLSSLAAYGPLLLVLALIGALILLGVLILETDFFGFGETMTRVLNSIVELPAQISGALRGLPDQLKSELFSPFEIETIGIIATLPRINTGLEKMVASIPGALRGLGGYLQKHLVDPFLSVIQPVIDVLDSILSKIAQIAGTDFTPSTPMSMMEDTYEPMLEPAAQIGGGSASPGNPLSPVGQFFGGIKKAIFGSDSGGKVYPGDMTLIGKRAQPELFLPGASGGMYPLNQWATAITRSVIQNNKRYAGDMSNVSQLMRRVITPQVVNRNTSVYSPHFYGTPARETVNTNLSLYDKWLMSTQGA